MDDMGVIARNKNQLTLIYSSEARVGKHTLSYLQGMDEKIHTVDITKTRVTGTQWAEIADGLGCKIGDLVDKRVVQIEDTSEFKSEDWIKILQHQGDSLSQPIAINGNSMKQITNPPEIMQFFGVESAGLEKTMHTEDPTTESKTEDENFI